MEMVEEELRVFMEDEHDIDYLKMFQAEVERFMLNDPDIIDEEALFKLQNLGGINPLDIFCAEIVDYEPEE